MAAWPSSLPQSALQQEFTESAEEVTIRSTVDVGPAKLRPRYTAEVALFQLALVLTTAQVATLDAFYQATLVFGSEAFDWTHPRTLAAVSMRFRSRPSYVPLGGGYWRTVLALEVMP